jgi:serine/threonine-protein kinase
MTRMTEQIGRVLGGRYRLLSPLGSGTSAQVYLADDVRLRRRVAIKLLHEALADDESFLRRFRAEAQAAAALSHPHLLAVYDWSDDEAPYLVTEYLGGGSLRSLLDAGDRLSPAQALVVGLEAARALEYAHRQGFVHRDIKPANLLFGSDGRLRVADFGLARAIAEAGWTEPAGAVLGTARYASPEQARGEALDGRSDVYSLALVLTEAVTGQVPFTADTTIGTLMARLDHSLEVPDELGPLGPVLVGAGKLEPADRLDAAGLSAGLVAAAPRLSRPEPLPLVGTSIPEAAPVDDRDATLLSATGVARAAAVDAAATTLVAAGPGAGGPDDVAATGIMTAVGAPPLGAPPGAPPGAAPPRPGGPPRGMSGRPGPLGPPGSPPRTWGPGGPRPGLTPADRGVRRLMLGAVVVVLAIAAGALVAGMYMKAQTPTHVIPTTVIGATKDQVVSGVSQYHWKIATKETRKDGTKAGQVLATDPKPGTELAEGKTLTLTVSLGPTLVAVPPNIVNASEADARAALAAVGLGEASVPQPSDTVPPGVVIGFAGGPPPAAGLPKGSTVKLNVSVGQRVVIPELAGKTKDEAVAALQGLGLQVDLRGQAPDQGQAPNTVLRLEPGAGTDVEPASTVVVVVAVDSVPVPDIIGMSREEAQQALEEQGLQLGRTIGRGQVAFVVPGPGSQVPPGTRIDVLLRRDRQD